VRLFVFACVVLLRCLRNFFTQELALRALRWVETGLKSTEMTSRWPRHSRHVHVRTLLDEFVE